MTRLFLIPFFYLSVTCCRRASVFSACFSVVALASLFKNGLGCQYCLKTVFYSFRRFLTFFVNLFGCCQNQFSLFGEMPAAPNIGICPVLFYGCGAKFTGTARKVLARLTAATICKQRGFSLVEVLISLFILSVGILGLAAMQLSAKRLGVDALQRTMATTLAYDMIERIRSNPVSLDNYSIENLGAGSVEPLPDCINAPCSARQLAERDLWEWEQALRGAAEQLDGNIAGGLVNSRACIKNDNDLLKVTVVWRGWQVASTTTATECGAGLDLYGDGERFQHFVSFTTVILR